MLNLEDLLRCLIPARLYYLEPIVGRKRLQIGMRWSRLRIGKVGNAARLCSLVKLILPTEIALFVSVAAAVITTFAYFGWFPIVMTVAYSYWLPQIYQNAERGTGRLPLLHSYILVTAAARLVIPLYVWACPSKMFRQYAASSWLNRPNSANLLFTENSPWVWALVAYQTVQVIFLLLQDTFGPRFFLPKGFWFEELDTWDYHPILPPSDIENPASGDGDKKDVDCIICFERIELAGSGRRDSIDARTSEKGEETAGASGAVGDVFDAARRGASRMSYMVRPNSGC